MGLRARTGRFTQGNVGSRFRLTTPFLLTLLAIWSLPGVAPLAGQDASPQTALEGRWEGEMNVPPVPLEVSVTLERAGPGWQGTFSLPAEGIREMPIAGVELRGDAAMIAVTPERVFHGRIDEGEMQGRFVFEDRGGDSVPMYLVRVGGPAWEAFERERRGTRQERDAVLAEHAPPPLERTSDGPAVGLVDHSALEELVRMAGASHSAAMVVLLDGELVGAWHAGGERRPIEAMSATKSVLNLAVGRLLTLGRLESLDVPVHAFYPEWAEGEHAEVTVRHLLNHTSGLSSPMPTDPIYASDDFIRFALESQLVAVPGTELAYNNNATNLLAGVIGIAADQRLDHFLTEELFGPLGITQFTWSLDSAGNPHGMAGLQILPEDLARLGQLVLQKGAWEGERLIDRAWFEESLAPGSEHSEEGGLLWWLIREDDRVVGARAEGYLGQYLVIYPDERLVGVRMVESFPGYDPDRDGFRRFQDLLRDLIPTPGS